MELNHFITFPFDVPHFSEVLDQRLRFHAGFFPSFTQCCDLRALSRFNAPLGDAPAFPAGTFNQKDLNPRWSALPNDGSGLMSWSLANRDIGKQRRTMARFNVEHAGSLPGKEVIG